MARETVERKSVFWSILVRVIALTSILASAVIIQYSAADFLPVASFYYLIFAAYGLSFIYWILYHWGKFYTFQAYLQVFFDLLFVTAFVYISGGIVGSTYFLYIFAIIGASLVINGRAGYLAAALSAVLFGLLVDGQYFKVIPYFSQNQGLDLTLGSVLFNVFIAWAAFFVVAFLMNYLSGSLRKAKEALREAQRELIIRERLAEAGRVSAGLAHEIRNPLAAISGSVQVLKDDLSLNEEQKSLMGIVLKESERVSQSIEQFLDFASPGKQVFSRISLSDLLDETLKMMKGCGDLNGKITLGGNFQTSNVQYYGNGNQFKQIFWNLAKNAIKAMPDGGVLTIDFVQNKKALKLRFSDTGKGMTGEDKSRLFEPFYSGFENGRGLGLVTVRRIVDDYDGRIEVISEVDKGTEVVITLPVKK